MCEKLAIAWATLKEDILECIPFRTKKGDDNV